MESRIKWFLVKLESLRLERLKMKRLRKTFSGNFGKIQKHLSPNWNHKEWKDLE
jgi:hypothetical protein